MIEFLRDLPYKTYVGLFLCSLFASYWLIHRVTWLARGLGLFARPNSREDHRIPSLGGLAVGLPFIAGISLLLLLRNQVSDNMYMVPLQMRGLFLGSCLILAIGFLQDLLRLSPVLRVFPQAAVAALAYYYGFRLEIFPESAAASFGLTLLWILGVVNFFDLLNRLNNLFTSVALILTLCLLAVSFYLDQYRTIVVCCLLSGSLVGLYSQDSAVRPNMGSAGTFFLGFLLAITTLQSHIVDGLYGLILFVLGSGLLTLVFVLKLPEYRPRLPGYSQDLHLRLRSLHYFRQAFALKMEAAADQEARWVLLCQAAEEFGYHSLVRVSSTGQQVGEWKGKGSGTHRYEFLLQRSGGRLQALGEAADTDRIHRERCMLFTALVGLFDCQQEEDILRQVGQRKNDLRVLLVNRYFSGMSATGQVLEDLAEDLCQAGAAVTVLTGGLSYENASLLPGRNELSKGIHICRVPATHFGRSNSLNRTMDFAFFYFFAIASVVRIPAGRYTHIVVFTDPPLIAIVGYLTKKLKGWRFIYSIQDLYPETALALGVLKKGWVYLLCHQVNMRLLRGADAIITIGEKMAEHIRRIANTPAPVEVVHNWADGRKIRPVEKVHDALMEELGLRQVYTLIYAGNMGLAQEIDALIQIVKAFKDHEGIQFIFMGGGVRRADLEAVVAEQKIRNVRFIAYQEKSRLSPYLGLADMGIVTLSPALEGLAIPTRTYSYLAAGIPILAIAHQDSDLKAFADQGLGVHFSSDQVGRIIEFLETEIKRGRNTRSAYIRGYYESHFDRVCQTQKYLALLK